MLSEGLLFVVLHCYLNVGSSLDDRMRFLDLFLRASGGLTVIFGGYVAWKNFLTAQASLRVSQEGQLTTRFTSAIAQLGATAPDNPGKKHIELRLGGIYALERIAWESETDHWPIMEVLVAYLRTNSPANPLCERPDQCTCSRTARSEPDIQAIARVLSRRKHLDYEDQNNLRLDLRGIDLSNVDLSGANLRRALLCDTRLCNAILDDADLSDADLTRACLRGARLLKRARIGGVNFLNAATAGLNLGPEVEEDDNTLLTDEMRARLQELRRVQGPLQRSA